MKRSRTVQLAFMSSVPLLVTACSGPGTDERIAYQDVLQCIQDGRVSKDVCEQEYQTALQARAQQQHFSNLNDCTAQFGEQCRPYVSPSGDHWFVPALAGFMIGRLMGHRDYGYNPYYGAGWGQGSNGSVYQGRPGRATWDGVRAGGDYGQGPTTAETLSRGGFGSSGAARSSWGG